MTYSVYSIANGFIDIHTNKRNISTFSNEIAAFDLLSKSLAHKDIECSFDRRSLCRWRYGPVVPSLYHKLKLFGHMNVDQLITIYQSS